MENSASSRFQININPRNWQAKEMLIFLFVVLFIGGSLAYIVSSPYFKKSPQQKTPTPTPSSSPSSLSSEMVVYGVWSENNSLIKTYDISTGKKYLLATLPKNIKKVNILSNNELIYINNTNERYLGKEIVVYNLESKKLIPVFDADVDFGIEDYRVSPNRRYLVAQEVKLPEGSKRAKDGQSRIYSSELSNPTTKYLIEDEDSSKIQFIHTPLAITNNGNIYLDKRLPNCDSVCTAYGIRVSDFTGDKKEDLTNMPNGTYGAFPNLSSDSKYIVFSGYDESMGPGTSKRYCARLGASHPNTVELLETATNSRKRLPNIPNDRIYADVYWDERLNDKLMILAASQDWKSIETYWYDLASYTLKKISSEYLDNIIDLPLSSLTDNSFLIGNQNRSQSTMGNLDKHGHAFMYTGLSILNLNTSSSSSLVISDLFIQFIGLKPSSFFQNLEEEKIGKKGVLQLDTFSLKPDFLPIMMERWNRSRDLEPNPLKVIEMPSILGCGSCCGLDKIDFNAPPYGP